MKNKFSIGDRVKVVKKVTALSKDFCNSWVTPMDESIGKTYTVESVGNFGIAFNEILWSFPPASLVKVGFSSPQELVNYMRRGGYILVNKLCYRIRKGVVEANRVDLSTSWSISIYSIEEVLKDGFYNLSSCTKRKYV